MPTRWPLRGSCFGASPDAFAATYRAFTDPESIYHTRTIRLVLS